MAIYYKDSGAYYVTTFTSVLPYKHDIEVIIQAAFRFFKKHKSCTKLELFSMDK